jgi:hypothetical protein
VWRRLRRQSRKGRGRFAAHAGEHAGFHFKGNWIRPVACSPTSATGGAASELTQARGVSGGLLAALFSQ